MRSVMEEGENIIAMSELALDPQGGNSSTIMNAEQESTACPLEKSRTEDRNIRGKGGGVH